MILLDISTFLGRLHPLMVHLPIGFILLAGIFNWASYFPKYKQLSTASEFALLLGAMAGVAACLMGWLLSKTGDYDYNLLEAHKISGIVLTALSFVLYFFLSEKSQSLLSIPHRVQSFIYLGLVILMSYAGHQGGNLTHGTEYLSLATLTEKQREKPENMEAVLVYEDLVQPILKSKCTQCHQAGKKKGELILTSFAELNKGGKNGPVILPGKVDNSELIRRVTLEQDHEEFMPTDGKTPLNQNELAILKWWITNDASGPETNFLAQKNNQEIAETVEVYLGFKEGNKTMLASADNDVNYNSNIPAVADENVLKDLKKGGFSYRIMNHSPLMLDISVDRNFKDNKLDFKVLEPMAKHIIWLNLTKVKMDAKGLESLLKMENLEKLKLDESSISNESLEKIASLKYLNSINLNKTQVTGQSLRYFKNHEKLKNIYVWQSKVSEKEALNFEKENPQIEVIL